MLCYPTRDNALTNRTNQNIGAANYAAWSSIIQYNAGDTITYTNGIAYVARSTITGGTPDTDTTHWYAPISLLIVRFALLRWIVVHHYYHTS